MKYPTTVEKYDGSLDELAIDVVGIHPANAAVFSKFLGDNMLEQSEKDYADKKPNLSTRLVLAAEQFYALANQLNELQLFLPRANIDVDFPNDLLNYKKTKKYPGTTKDLAHDVDILLYYHYMNLIGAISSEYELFAESFEGKDQGIQTRLELIAMNARAAHSRMADVWNLCEKYMQN